MLEDIADGLCLIHLKRSCLCRHRDPVDTFLIRFPYSRRGTRCGVRIFLGKQEASDNISMTLLMQRRAQLERCEARAMRSYSSRPLRGKRQDASVACRLQECQLNMSRHRRRDIRHQHRRRHRGCFTLFMARTIGCQAARRN